MDTNALWQFLMEHQGREYRTAKQLPFTYQIRGGEMFVDRKAKSITRATVERAYRRILEDDEHNIQGPKALNCFGAPYLWAIFVTLGIAGPPKRQRIDATEE
ncbi:MAG: hypothetical protein LUE65_01935 [Clostridiales bacterium]|nr:hypothetical protein [Clostridiales bacterium]